MEIRYVKYANLLQSPIRFLTHGCNAQGVMGSGVAGAIRQAHPEVYEVYRKAYENHGNRLNLGEVVWAPYDDGSHVVGNLISQEHFGRGAQNGEVYVSYDAIEAGFLYFDAFFEGRRTRRSTVDEDMEELAMPLIGAGLAGGSWTRISAIIENRARHFKQVVYLLDGAIPTT